MISDYISVSDEAFAILIFENNYETWCDMVKRNNTKLSPVIQKYTNGGSSSGKNGSSRRYQGWNSEGIKRFNDLFDLVKADRESAHAKPFEEAFKNYCENEGVSKQKKADNIMFDTLNVRHELWSDDEELNAVGLQCMMQYENEDDEEEAENPLPDGNSDDDILEKYTEI